MAHGSTAAHFDEPQLTPVHFHLRNINVWAEYAINYMTIWHYTSYIQLYLYRILSALSQAAPWSMLQVKVALTSGRSETLSLPESSKVGDLKLLAQRFLGRRFFKLVTGDGQVLDEELTLHAAVEDGGQLSAIVQQAKLAATGKAFALWCYGGSSIVTWGSPDHGADTSTVQDQLKNLQQIQATGGAFAALLGDGSVVTWGSSHAGGDSFAVQDQLENVQQVEGTDYAFAAILSDGSVVTWGDEDFGGDSSAVQAQLKAVRQIKATVFAFAAIMEDGSLVTWGDPQDGSDSSSVQDQLRSVQQVQATWGAFAALLADRSVVSWGNPSCGGDSSAVQDQLRDVQQIWFGGLAFAAGLSDGSVVTWGDPEHGGNSSAVQDQLRNVQQVQGSLGAFAVILGDGSVVTWGQIVVVTAPRSKTDSGATDSGDRGRICSDLGGWLSSYMGSVRLWRR